MATNIIWSRQRLSNLRSVDMERKQYARAEEIYRDVVRRYTEELSPNHPNTGIARIKLGRSLLRQQRYAEAEVESRAGYEILIKQTNPTISWLQNARQDLAEEYTALGRPADTAKFKAEFALGGIPSVSRGALKCYQLPSSRTAGILADFPQWAEWPRDPRYDCRLRTISR